MTNQSQMVPNLAANDILAVTGDYIFLEVGSHYNSVLLLRGDSGSTVVKVLCNKSEGC